MNFNMMMTDVIIFAFHMVSTRDLTQIFLINTVCKNYNDSWLCNHRVWHVLVFTSKDHDCLFPWDTATHELVISVPIHLPNVFNPAGHFLSWAFSISSINRLGVHPMLVKLCRTAACRIVSGVEIMPPHIVTRATGSDISQP